MLKKKKSEDSSSPEDKISQDSNTQEDFQSYCSLLDNISINGAIFDCNGEKLSDTEVNSENVAWRNLSIENKEHHFYNGVGKYGSCTGTLLDTGANDNAPAYIITNAHCTGLGIHNGLPEGKGAYFDVSSGSKTMTFNYYLDATPESHIIIDSKIIRYSSMEATDVAIVELDATVGELKAKNLRAFSLAAKSPVII